MAWQYLLSIMLFNLLIISVGTLIFALFLYQVQRTLRLVNVPNRDFSPPLVWLCLIPLIGFFFAVFMVSGVARSIKKQLHESANIRVESSFGKIAGWVWVFPILAVFILEMVGFSYDLATQTSPIIQGCLFVSFVAWIVYWTQINGFRKLLLALGGNDYSTEELDYGDGLEKSENRIVGKN